MNKNRFMLLCFFFCLSFHNASAFWLDTHETITGNAITNANLTSVIKSQTGIDNGLSLSVTVSPLTYTLEQWLKYGSKQEDEPLLAFRYLNHFYNPITNSGLADFPFYGTSSYEWANGNDWGWQTARSNYFTALTASTDNGRKVALANSFRAIGQVMHLVQDLASVAHVRNDAHPLGDGFEEYANSNIGNLSFSAATIAIPTTSITPFAPKQFWDSDSYDGSNPAASNSIGLSEYTNANFISEDTKFNTFTYPRWADMQYYEEPAGTWGNFYKYRKYYRKISGGEQIEHFVNAGRLTKYLDTYTVLQTNTLGLDDKVYSDYAQKLIPRAVGYSAGLLNYFFRGKVNMDKDPQNAGKYIIKNESGERMEGTFALYYDDAAGNRNAVPGASWTLTINPNSISSPVTFTEPTSPAPKEKGKYILVFQGKLGAEEGAVVGREVALSCGGSHGTIIGPDKVDIAGTYASYYTLNWPNAMGRVKWTTDNPWTYIFGSNTRATLYYYRSGVCTYNGGVITITATDECGNKTTFKVEAGLWVLTGKTTYCGSGYKCSNKFGSCDEILFPEPSQKNVTSYEVCFNPPEGCSSYSYGTMCAKDETGEHLIPSYNTKRYTEYYEWKCP